MKQTLEHVWWHCPRHATARQTQLRDVAVKGLSTAIPDVTLRLGLPTYFAALQNWTAPQTTQTADPAWTIAPEEIFTDGSALRPTVWQLRSVG